MNTRTENSFLIYATEGAENKVILNSNYHLISDTSHTIIGGFNVALTIEDAKEVIAKLTLALEELEG